MAQETSLVEFRAPQRDEDAVVVAMRILALATVVAEVVAGREAGFYGYFKHRLLPFAAAGRWQTRLPLLYVPSGTFRAFRSVAAARLASFFGASLGLLEE